jgi:hypothetical protein
MTAAVGLSAVRIGVNAWDASVPDAGVEAAPANERALVPVERVDDRPPRPSLRRGSASFIAQLIATDLQLPQTRERRRAEPREALIAYGAAARLGNKRR